MNHVAIFSLLQAMGKGGGSPIPSFGGGSLMPGCGGGGMMSLVPLLGLLLLVFLLSKIFNKNRGLGPLLVLRKFHVEPAPGASVIVDIAGRPSGLVSFLLTIMKLDEETSIQVTKGAITFKSSSLSGQFHQVAPIRQISSTHCGYSKPIILIILGVFLPLVGVFTGSYILLLVTFLLGALCLVGYFFSKKITLSIITSGGTVMGLQFKRSVLENVDVDINKAKIAIEAINNLIQFN